MSEPVYYGSVPSATTSAEYAEMVLIQLMTELRAGSWSRGATPMDALSVASLVASVAVALFIRVRRAQSEDR